VLTIKSIDGIEFQVVGFKVFTIGVVYDAA